MPFYGVLILLFLWILSAAVGWRGVPTASIVGVVICACIHVSARPRFLRIPKELSALNFQLKHDADRAERRKHGLRSRTNFDVVVDPSEWKSEFNQSADWVEGEAEHLLLNDTVLKFFWVAGPLFARGGYAIERKGKIVAENITFIS
jgi:hypothetical protein